MYQQLQLKLKLASYLPSAAITAATVERHTRRQACHTCAPARQHEDVAVEGSRPGQEGDGAGGRRAGEGRGPRGEGREEREERGKERGVRGARGGRGERVEGRGERGMEGEGRWAMVEGCLPKEE